MKRLILGTALLGSACAVQAELVITAVYDGPLTGGVPKGIELYATEAIADLGEYGVGSANNGNGSSGVEFTFPNVSLAAGEYIYLATEEEQFNAFFGFAPDFTSSSAMSINGDDAIELFHHGVVVDLFGDVNTDGTGQSWEYLDGWAARSSGASASATFDLSQWSFSGPNALDGAADNISSATPVPIETFVSSGGNGAGDGEGGGSNGEGDSGDGDTPALRLISEIQGNPGNYGNNSFGDSDVSPLIDQRVLVEAVVVGDFQDADADESRNLRGFYLQEESLDSDGDDNSSEGIFVFDESFGVDVVLGDRVQVIGSVYQYFGETQIGSVSEVNVLDSDALGEVTPATISLPSAAVSRAQDGSYQPDLEAFEGMLVRVAGPLQVTEQFQLDRFNEIKLVVGERPYQFTQLNNPGVDGYEAFQRALGARRVTYDDGLNEQNAAIANLDGFAAYSEASAIRMGDTIAELVGVLDYKWAGNASSGATWRVRAAEQGSNVFNPSPNPRAAVPELSGDLRLASLNVLNFFSTLDTGGATTAVGMDPRGADSQDELGRQLAKLVHAISAMDADVLGLVEIENEFDDTRDGSTAIEVLVDAVNAALGSQVYDYVYPGASYVGTDAIAVAVMYKRGSVTPAAGTEPALLDDVAAANLAEFSGRDFETDPLFSGAATNRVPLAVSFEHRQSGEVFTVVVNHFKSKGSSGLEDTASANYDQVDGAGFWNQRREDAARALLAWLDTAPTGVSDTDVALLGDLNAYAMESPVQLLLDHGFANVEPYGAYSYVFDGQIGTLDYILLSDSLMDRMDSAAVWHSNADEADALDYNLDFGRDAAYFNGTTATRHSDHDPVMVGLKLSSGAPPVTLDQVLSAFDYAVNTRDRNVIRGRRGIGQLFAFSITLRAAERFEQWGWSRQACRKIELALGASDSESGPKDWVVGSAVSGLNDMLARVYADKDC